MLSKDSKIIPQKCHKHVREFKCIPYSANQTISNLSESFYGEETLKMNKQVIMDEYDGES
jgi:hypothetical protein